jgi:hypothetical protein
MMLFIELLFTRQWSGHKFKLLRLISILLLMFLIFQLIIGFASG